MFRNNIIKALGLLFFVVSVSSCASKKSTTFSIGDVTYNGAEGQKRVQFDEIFFSGLSSKYAGDDKGAMEYFQQCLKLDSKNAATQYELSQIYLKMGMNNEAVNLAEQAYNSDSQNEWYLENLAQTYASAKMYGKSADCYEKLLEKNPTELNYYYDLGAVYMYENNAVGAISTYENLEKVMGFDNAVAEQLFKLYEYQKMDAKAEAKLKELVDHNPTEIRYISMLASYYKSKGETQKAIDLYEGLKADYPNDPYVKLALYEYYSELGERKTAFQNLEEAFLSEEVSIDAKVGILLALMDVSTRDEEIREEVKKLMDIMAKVHPDDAKTWAIYGDFLNMHEQFEEARKMYLKSIEIDGSKYQVWSQVLFIDTELNDQEGLLNHSKECVEIFPNQMLPHYFMGVVYMQRADYTNAIAALEKAKELVYGMPELEVQILGNLGDAYYQVGNLQKSWLAYDQALRIDPSNDYVLNNYAYFLSEQNENLEEAEKMSKITIQKNPESPTYLDTYGWIKYKQGDYLEAVKYLEMAKKYSEKPGGEILEHLGDAYFQAGRPDDALEQWEAAKTAGGASSAIDSKIANKKL